MKRIPLLAALLLVQPLGAQIPAQLSNQYLTANFGQTGLTALTITGPSTTTHALHDAWSLTLDNDHLDSKDATPTTRASSDQITYTYQIRNYQIDVLYRLRPEWNFVTKQIVVVHAPRSGYTVHSVAPLALDLDETVADTRVPTSYTPQLGRTIAQTHQALPGRDFGLFLRFGGEPHVGLMLLAQNPFLEITHTDRSAALRYAPEMPWESAWGPFRSDAAVLGPYRLTGRTLPREMLLEWKQPGPAQPQPGPAQPQPGPAQPQPGPAQLQPGQVQLQPGQVQPQDGLDTGEVDAFTACVRAFLLSPPAEPTRVEVGWTLNDYQVDVATEAGKQEYHRILDATADLGLTTLLFAPTNSSLAKRDDDTDSWHWEHTLWLNLGQKIRKGEWDPATSPIPADVAAMIAYGKSKHVGLLAYVYPSVPFAQDSSWLVHGSGKDAGNTYATLASRPFQDMLLHDLIAFKRRTGIAGYSFDYAFLDFAGSSSYAQWFGWRRVMEELKRSEPDIVIDGRQSYQLYGPWSWLAGSYPHPTGHDEQPESFLPYPDLHFDRVSADRTRYVNFWYRNYQFAPSEIVPGYATHQTERSRNVPPDAETGGHPQHVEEVHTAFRLRDWDYLGFRYSFLSSIATGGWNNVVDMIPARDAEEFQHFPTADKVWIRTWLDWTSTHKELLRHTRTILHQPSMGQIDGASAIAGDRGFLFLFNPNYRALQDTLPLDSSIGLTRGSTFVLREVYPQAGRLWGKRDAGVWTMGDAVPLALAGTSATVLEILPASESEVATNAVFNAAASNGGKPAFALNGTSLALTGVAGEPGTTSEIGVLLPRAQTVRTVTVNGQRRAFQQNAGYIAIPVSFGGDRFTQAQQVPLESNADGTMRGTLVVPGRVMEQLRDRAKAWPIPWTADDYATTWLAPERLLLFLQAAEATDSMAARLTIDGKPVEVKRAYTSTRVHPEAFVGLYADLSRMEPDVPHTLILTLSGVEAGSFQGAFFDNVEPQFTMALRDPDRRK